MTDHSKNPLQRGLEIFNIHFPILFEHRQPPACFCWWLQSWHFDLSSVSESLQHPTGPGIITGLVLGEFIGISAACWIGLRFIIGRLPDGVNLQHVISASLIAGIGFTMSTFIATLGFDSQPENLHIAKTAIMIASILSAFLGVLYILFISTNKHNKAHDLTPKNSAN